jgi:hypothetical protein
MPHFKINIWICLGLALLGCIYPSYLQAGGLRARQVKAVAKSVSALAERLRKKDKLFLRDKKLEAPRTQGPLIRTIESDKKAPLSSLSDSTSVLQKDDWSHPGQSQRLQPSLFRPQNDVLYAQRASKLLERYTHDVEFQRSADQMRAKLIEQGIDEAQLMFLPKHSMLDEHSSVRFVANQSDKDIDESAFHSRLSDDMKKIAKIVLDNAVRNVPLFEFLTESECTSALKDAVKKACDELNRVEECLPWTLKLESDDLFESEDLVFQPRDDNLPDAKLSIKITLSKLANLANYESIQTAPSEPRG